MTLTFDDHLEAARLLYRSALQDGAVANESAARYRQERDDARAEADRLLAELVAAQQRIEELEQGAPPEPPKPLPVWETLFAGSYIRKNPVAAGEWLGQLGLRERVEELERRTDGSDVWVRHERGWTAAHYGGRQLMKLVEPPSPEPDGLHFDPPVGTLAERRGPQVWPGTWFDATGFATYYTAVGPAYHTGADLNNNSPAWDSDRLAPVYAAGDGVVTHAGKLGGTWGNVVVVEHAPLLHTRYAHLADFSVEVGQRVARGQQMARVGNAGGQVAYHLHFDVSTSGVLKAQPGHWPGNDRAAVLAHYADPKAFILARRPPANPAEALLPHGRVLVGAGVTDPAEWQLTAPGVAALRQAKADAVLLIAPGCTQAVFDRVRQANPEMFVAVRLMPGALPPAEFVARCLPDLKTAHANGVRFFQPGNEPNARVEGYGVTHTDGYTFGEWWVDVVNRLRPELPGSFFLLPCPSPDPSFQGNRAFWPFLEATERAIRDAGARVDGYGLHVYWPNPGTQGQAIQAVRDFAKARPGSLVFVTEFSRQPGDDKDAKGREYREFVEAQYPGEVKVLIGFALQGGSEWARETWAGSEIPAIVGARQSVASVAA